MGKKPKPWDTPEWKEMARKFLTTPEKAYVFLKGIKLVSRSRRPKFSSGMTDTFHDLLRDTGIPFSQISSVPLAFLDAFGKWKYGEKQDDAFREKMLEMLKALAS